MKRSLKGLLAVFLPAALLSAIPVLADVPSAAGSNFQVNEAFQGSQFNPAAAEDAAGNFVVVWIDQGAFPVRVKARLYGASGAPKSGEILVTATSPLGAFPRVAMTPLGAFAVAWDDTSNIYLRRFDRLGQPAGEAVAIPGVDYGRSHSPDVALDAAGNAAIVWAVSRFDGDLIFLERFDAASRPLGLPEQVNQNVFNSRDNPRVAVGPAGSLLVSWDDRRAVLPNVWARRFDGPRGAWSREVRVSSDGSGVQEGSVPIFYPQGDGAVVFSDFTANQVRVRRLDAAGATLGGPIRLGDLGGASTLSSAAAGPDGTVLAVWQGADNHLHGGFFDHSWRPLGETSAVSDPLPGIDWEPAVAGGPGGFLVAWNNGGQTLYIACPLPIVEDGRDGSQLGVFAQRFQTPGCAAGSEVLCLGADNRFAARVSWKNPYNGDTGTGKALPLTGDTGAFWFFDPGNLELMIKVLDGRSINGSFWVFYGSLSNVEYTVTVTDTATGAVKAYHNAPLQLASRADVDAFPAPASLTAGAAAKAATVPLASPASSPFAAGTCDALRGLCLARNRFQVQVDFVDPRTGSAGKGRAVPLTEDTGVFWFFDPANLELMVKVLDGRAINGELWVFYGGLSDVEYTITVTDEASGAKRTYHNAPHHLASVADTTAFPAGGGD
jgi:hypothetical protein